MSDASDETPTDKHYDVLLRVAAELAYRTASTRRYLSNATLRSSHEHSQVRQIGEIIREAMIAIEDRIGETISSVNALPPERSSERVRVFRDQLVLFSRLFTKIHEFLWFLPHQQVTREAIALLKSCFDDLYDELQHPSVLLGSLFNALEFDFLELMRSRIPDLDKLLIDPRDRVVLHLAVCDRSSPPAWAILAHEMGHAADEKREISAGVIRARFGNLQGSFGELVSNWCGEFCADLIAARGLGPSPVAALLSAEYAMFPSEPVCVPSVTHPTTRMRLHVVRDYLSVQGGDQSLLQSEAKVYEAAWELSSEEIPQEVVDNSQLFFENFMKPLVDEIVAKVDALPLSQYVPDRLSLNRCADRLERSSPVSAQGAPREELREKIRQYRDRSFPSTDEQLRAFRELTREFTERPLPLPAVLLACYERRVDEFEKIRTGETPFASGSEIRKASGRLTRLDGLISQSITTGMIHREL